MSAFSTDRFTHTEVPSGLAPTPLQRRKKQAGSKVMQTKVVKAAAAKTKARAVDSGVAIFNAKQFKKFHECMTSPAQPSKEMVQVSAEILEFSKLLR